MRKIIVLILFFLMIAFYVTHVFSEVVVVKVKEGLLKNSPQGEEIGVIGEGVTCQKIVKEGEWTKVKLEGWIKTTDVIVLKLDIDKDEQKKKEYVKLAPQKLRLEGILDTYEGRKISFEGKFGNIFEGNKKVANHINFTVSSVECYIHSRDYNKIQQIEKNQEVRIYGKVRRGFGQLAPWYYIKVEDIIKK